MRNIPIDKDNFINWAFGLFLVIAFLSLSYVSCQETDEDKECYKKYGNKSHSIERPYTITKRGCRVIQLTKYTGFCAPISTVYVTECPCEITVTDPEKDRKEKLEKEEKILQERAKIKAYHNYLRIQQNQQNQQKQQNQ